MRIFNNLLEKISKSPLLLLFWIISGRKNPPPHVYKQSVIKSYAEKYDIESFIETGTYKGDMINAVKERFKKIISIELSDFYYRNAREKFKKHNHISIIFGDSSKELKKVLKSVDKSVLFWLDGHFSGGKTAKAKINTPIIEELKNILSHKIKSHLILIDDARLFNGKEDYPKINQLRKLIRNTSYELSVKQDIIRISPKDNT